MKYFFFLFFLFPFFLFGQLKTEMMDSLLLYGKHSELLHFLEKLPQNSQTFYQSGIVYQDKADYYNALLNYVQATHLENSFKHQFKVIKMNMRLQRYRKAEELLTALEQQYSNNEAILLQKAKLYHLQNKWNKAIDTYTQLVKQHPNTLDYAYGLGTAYMAKKDFSTAIDHLLLVYEKDSTHFNTSYRLAQAFQELRLADSTYVFVEKGKQFRPDHKNLNRIYIKQLHRDKAYKKAITVLKQQDKLYPNEFFNQKMLAVCYYNLTDYQKAKMHFSNALDLNPEDHKSYTYLGHIDLKEGSYLQAYMQYFKALKTNRISREKEYYGLGMTSIAIDDFKNAQKFLELAYNENKRDPLIVFELAKILDHNAKGGKGAYRYFKEYAQLYAQYNLQNTAYANKRLKEIKEAYFLKGEVLD